MFAAFRARSTVVQFIIVLLFFMGSYFSYKIATNAQQIQTLIKMIPNYAKTPISESEKISIMRKTPPTSSTTTTTTTKSMPPTSSTTTTTTTKSTPPTSSTTTTTTTTTKSTISTVQTRQTIKSSATSSFTNYTLDYFHIPSKNLSSDLKLRIKTLSAFEVQITLEELDVMRDLLQMFDSVMKKNNIPYMLYGGTLLGSYRHHDIIPWDDDLDLWVNLTERPKMQDMFKSLEPKYIFVKAGSHDKIYRHDAQKPSTYGWGWPYIDVSYYKENETHIWDIANAYGLSSTTPKSVVFPLHNRPLYNLSLPAPLDSYAALRWAYPDLTNICYMFGYSHMLEAGGPYGKRNCSELADRYAFVHRYPHPKGIREVLQFKGHNLTEFVTLEPTYAITETYKLSLKPGFTPPPDVSLPTH